MTHLATTSSSSEHACLQRLFVQVSGLLENCAEPAEQRVRRAGALLRGYPLQVVQGSEINFTRARRTVLQGALLAWQIRRVTEHIESHIESAISIRDLASIARLSPSYFCRSFRASLHVTPHGFIMRRRIARSHLLMSSTQTPLSQIAADCGFADQPHFSRVHRRLVGIAPGAWRRNRQAGQAAGAPSSALAASS